jgi:hypothetical protein
MGSPGPSGAVGPSGPTGPSHGYTTSSTTPVTLTGTAATVVSQTVPSGTYVIAANVALHGGIFGTAVTCTLNSGATVLDTESADVSGSAHTQLVLSGGATGVTSITVSCSRGVVGSASATGTISSIMVGGLN